MNSIVYTKLHKIIILFKNSQKNKCILRSKNLNNLKEIKNDMQYKQRNHKNIKNILVIYNMQSY